MPRLFIALQIPDDVAGRLAQVMATEADGWRWVRRESLHLTLVFLGNVDEQTVDTVSNAMHRAAANAAPMELSIRGLGAFPNQGHAKVLWAGVEGQLDVLHSLHERLERELREAGFRLEERAYLPHVTLARSRAPRRMPTHLDAQQAFGAWTAGEVILLESQLSSSGARYLVRARARLGGSR